MRNGALGAWRRQAGIGGIRRAEAASAVASEARVAVQNGRENFMNYFNALVVDPGTPIQWRQTRAEGGGVLADIGSHLIDLALWLLGPIARVRCDLRTFTPERPSGQGGMAMVDVDDAASCQIEFASGAIGIMNASGVCLGRGNHQRVELYGTKGSILYEIDAPADRGGDRLHVCFGAAQHRTACLAEAHTLPRHQATPLDPFLDFFRAVRDGRPAAVTFADALRVQAVLEAAERSAAAGGAWVGVVDVANVAGAV